MPSGVMRVCSEDRKPWFKAGARNGQSEEKKTIRITKKATNRRVLGLGNRESGVTRTIVITKPDTAKSVRPETNQHTGGLNSRLRSNRGRATRVMTARGIKYPSVHHGFGIRENQRPSTTPRVA